MKPPTHRPRFARLRRWPCRTSRFTRHLRYRTVGLALLSALATPSCDPRVVIATPNCTSASTGESLFGDGSNIDSSEPFQLPWSTGFERGFCDYSDAAGYCYASGTAAYKLVESPVHSGRFAAAFSATADNVALPIMQARCVRQGQLPTAAIYGAWYFVPSISKPTGFWNLIHFHGGSSASDAHNLWDISLVNDSTGALRLSVYNHLATKLYDLANPVPVPIGTWFHIEVYLKRAADTTGELVLYQDGIQVLQLSGLVTDNTTWGQFYVGNLVIKLEPPESTLFVDDVTVSKRR